MTYAGGKAEETNQLSKHEYKHIQQFISLEFIC